MSRGRSSWFMGRFSTVGSVLVAVAEHDRVDDVL